MNDAYGAVPGGADEHELTAEISKSMGTVWQRHTGQRPDSVATEVGTDRVRCVIAGAEAPASGDEAPASGDEVATQTAVLLTASAQRNEAIESVRRATHRRVVGFIATRDDDAGTSTQTFILDGRRARN
jgi:hypothetical protein